MRTVIEELEQIMQSEVELGESLLKVIMEKQQSIVGLHGDHLTSLVIQEESLIRPFQHLEQKRVQLARELIGGQGSDANPVPITLSDILRHLDAPDALRITTISMRLRTVSERIIHMNDQNRILLQRSLRFVQDTLRMVTDDHTRQLVDHRL
jgi:flagellar biosynthesis/type III secretory pathway chaperone